MVQVTCLLHCPVSRIELVMFPRSPRCCLQCWGVEVPSWLSPPPGTSLIPPWPTSMYLLRATAPPMVRERAVDCRRYLDFISRGANVTVSSVWWRDRCSGRCNWKNSIQHEADCVQHDRRWQCRHWDRHVSDFANLIYRAVFLDVKCVPRVRSRSLLPRGYRQHWRRCHARTEDLPCRLQPPCCLFVRHSVERDCGEQ